MRWSHIKMSVVEMKRNIQICSGANMTLGSQGGANQVLSRDGQWGRKKIKRRSCFGRQVNKDFSSRKNLFPMSNAADSEVRWESTTDS